MFLTVSFSRLLGFHDTIHNNWRKIINEIPEDQPPANDSVGSSSRRPKWFARKDYSSPAEKKKDFWLGVGLFFLLNILLGLCSWGVLALFGYSGALFNVSTSTYSDLYSVLTCILGLLPWILNIGLVIYFAFTRNQIAYGMVAGFAIALLIVICLGVVFAAFCFFLYNI